MKTMPTQLYYFLRNRPARRNVFSFVRFLIVLAVLVTLYSILFHYIMAWEGRNYSWITGFYWTLTVMSTLGFGDITFESDLGRIFSIVVLLSGVFFLLILFPFIFIEFFYIPWTRAQAEARAPSELPKDTHNHIILTALDPITRFLIKKFEQYHFQYVLLVSEIEEALRLNDQGYRVMVGDLDNPITYKKARSESALMVVTTMNDMVNTNVAFTVQEFTRNVHVIATANSPASVDILELAGCDHVLQVSDMMGMASARRVEGPDRLAHIIGRFDELAIAESTVRNTGMVGKTLRELRLREQIGITVLGYWERAEFKHIHADKPVQPEMAFVLAGSEDGIQKYNDTYTRKMTSPSHTIVIGGGRVGRAVTRGLLDRGLDYRVVELLPDRIREPEKYIIGDAAEFDVLEQAGIMNASSVIITPHDDDANIYLTIYCRRLRPDIQIISRATYERNVATLQRAGADFIMSSASLGSNVIMNLIDNSNVLMVAEGLDVFQVRIPDELVGRTLAETQVREKTDCTVVALKNGSKMDLDFSPHISLPADVDLLVIGTASAEKKFRKVFG